MPETIVPVIAIFVIFGAPIAAWIVTRVLAHQERMEMLRRGFVPPPDPRAMHNAAKFGMKGGWVPGPPPGMSVPPPGVSVPPPGWASHAYDPSYHAQAHLRKGVQIAFVGLALLIGLSFIGMGHGNLLGPWLLGGLIPLFVGVAQIITAIMGGAQFGRLTVGCDNNAYIPPEPPHSVGSQQATSAGPSGPPPPPSSYGGWRPGNTPEIEPPASPPDRR